MWSQQLSVSGADTIQMTRLRKFFRTIHAGWHMHRINVVDSNENDGAIQFTVRCEMHISCMVCVSSSSQIHPLFSGHLHGNFLLLPSLNALDLW